ncbi:MAG: DNA/RNA non-specific endonuclease, partial [Rhodoferax sp.]|nr:DNA/RNA non-specific endonuclease [Rhodoferax sp.]
MLACVLAAALATVAHAADDFQDCLQFFARAQPPLLAPGPGTYALCNAAFAVLYSGASKTPLFVAERLNRASVAQAHERRGNVFHADSRVPQAERATLEDYAGSGYDRGHMAPAADMGTAQAMEQSFSLANTVPQAPEHNRGAWAQTVELPTRKFAARAEGDVYVITGPVFVPSMAQSPSIGAGKVHVPAFLFKLVYDEASNRAWAYWQANTDTTRGSQPISYAELVLRTGVVFLPGVRP